MRTFLHLAIVLPFLILGINVSAQRNILSDAIALRQYCGPDNGRAILTSTALEEDENGDLFMLPTVANVLAPYCGVAPDAITQNVLTNTFNTALNPFVRIGFPEMSGVKSTKFKIPTTPNPPISGSPVSIIVDGIARFLVKRTKDELTLAFFDDFKKELQRNETLQYFFPGTCSILKSIDTDVYNFRIYLEAIRDAYIADMHVLPSNLEFYLRDRPVEKVGATEQAIAIDFFHLAQMAIDGAPAHEMVSYGASANSAIQLGFKVNNDEKLRNISCGLRFVDLLSQSLFDPVAAKWYPGSEIDQALSDPVTMQIFLGLLWHEAKAEKITFKNGVTLEDIVGKAASSASLLQSWQQQIREFGRTSDQLQNTLAERKNDAELPDNFSRYTQYFTRLLQSANNLSKLMTNSTEDVIDGKYLLLTQQITALNFNVRQKQYSAAIGNTVFILEILLGKKFTGKSEILRYGSFLASIAEAESPEEVQDAIESFALPPGSAKAKKGDGNFSVAVNAYTGVNLSGERFRSSSSSTTTLGLAAPIGFSINWGQTWGKKHRDGSIGFFFPVIDVGAVFAYRFKEDAYENLPPLEWKNIISPGAYLTVNPPLRKFQLSLGLGGQMGPLLRKVEKNGVFHNEDVGGYRIGGFATLDIPINFLRLKKGK